MNEIIGPRAFGVENQITRWPPGTKKLLSSHKSLCEKLAPPLQVTVAVVIAYGATMTDNSVNRFFNTGPKIAHADDDNAPDMNVGLSNIQNPIPSFSELINAIPDPTIIGAFDENPELSEETQEWSLKTTKGVFTRTSTGVLRFTENGIPGQKNVWVVKLGEQNLSEQDHAYSRGENELFAFEVANPPQSYYAQSENLEPVIETSHGDSGGTTLEQAIVNGFTGPGFQSIFMAMPLVGKAISPETPLANGDVMQLTENGAMFWRKADNWTAYTDGSRTWVMGPSGLQERGNDQRFDWEKQITTEAGQAGQIKIIENEGGPAFTKHVQDALDLLKQKDPEHYQLVANAGIIQFLKGSGSRVGVSLQKEPYSILLGEEAINRGLISLAGSLGHEAEHIKQERKYFADHPEATFSAPGTTVGIKADGEALEVAAEICERLGDSYEASYHRFSIGIYDGSAASGQKALEAFLALQGGK